MGLRNDHVNDCGCIDCKAAREFFGPASYLAPSMITVGDHKREAWDLRPVRDAARDDKPKPTRVATTRTPIKRDAHPFGYKKRRKSKPLTGRIDPADVTVTRKSSAKPDPDMYVKNPDSWVYKNRLFS